MSAICSATCKDGRSCTKEATIQGMCLMHWCMSKGLWTKIKGEKIYER